jgi:hypothetical protein
MVATRSDADGLSSRSQRRQAVDVFEMTHVELSNIRRWWLPEAMQMAYSPVPNAARRWMSSGCLLLNSPPSGDGGYQKGHEAIHFLGGLAARAY